MGEIVKNDETNTDPDGAFANFTATPDEKSAKQCDHRKLYESDRQ